VDVSRHIRQADWLMIPAVEDYLEDAMAVFYFDLGAGRIPARYERHLPMPVADIERQLDAGKSFIVAKEREGAPPTLLLAAPRTAMLEEVEKALAELAELPTKPVYIEVPANLRPAEIQSVVRNELMGKVRGCYEQLLKSEPDARGDLMLEFTIAPSGSLSRRSVQSDDAPLRNPEFTACVDGHLAELAFPATAKETTVTYPIKVSPE
jgi:hypothetical protein